VSLKTRLDKVESLLNQQDNGVKLYINIIDGEGKIHECANHKDICGALPCDMSGCWMAEPRSGVRIINIDVEEDTH